MQLNEETLSRFQNQHKIIKHYIDDLPPEAINNRLSADKWSIQETIAYLCRYQYIFMDRLKSIQQEINPFFEMYKPADDPEFNHTLERSTGSLLHEIYRIRDELCLLLENLPPENFSRFGTHAILGKMDLCQWVEFFLLHESNQLYKIFRLAGSFWSADSPVYGSKVINLPRMQSQVDELAG